MNYCRYYYSVELFLEEIELQIIKLLKQKEKLKWNDINKSKFIETVLYKIPCNDIVLAHEENQTIVLDGNERINTLILFITNKFSLVGGKWRGKTYNDLSSHEKINFDSYILSTITIPDTEYDLSFLRDIYY